MERGEGIGKRGEGVARHGLAKQSNGVAVSRAAKNGAATEMFGESQQSRGNARLRAGQLRLSSACQSRGNASVRAALRWYRKAERRSGIEVHRLAAAQG